MSRPTRFLPTLTLSPTYAPAAGLDLSVANRDLRAPLVNKLARIIYYMLRDRTPYHDPGAKQYEEQHQARIIRNLKRNAARLGMQLIPVETLSDTVTLSLDQTVVF